MFLAFWYWLIDLKQAQAVWPMPFVWLGMNPLLAYCGAQIGSLALGVLYMGTPTQHTHLITLIMIKLFGENWDVVGLTHWWDPRWPSLCWAMIYLSFWTLVVGFLYGSESSSRYEKPPATTLGLPFISPGTGNRSSLKLNVNLSFDL
jgi:hypothetical protein